MRNSLVVVVIAATAAISVSASAAVTMAVSPSQGKPTPRPTVTKTVYVPADNCHFSPAPITHSKNFVVPKEFQGTWEAKSGQVLDVQNNGLADFAAKFNGNIVAVIRFTQSTSWELTGTVVAGCTAAFGGGAIVSLAFTNRHRTTIILEPYQFYGVLILTRPAY